jgi:hypothetical protein
MDKKCVLVKFSGEHLLIESGPVAVAPVIDSELTKALPKGSLSKGVYFYTVTAVGVNGESAPFNVLQVCANHAQNSVLFSWVPQQYILEYRVYRGSSPDTFDGYFTVYTNTGYFYDDGTGSLNGSRTKPPEFTDSPSNQDRKVHKKAIKKTSSMFLSGTPNLIHVYVVLLGGEMITLDLNLVINQPNWRLPQKVGLLRALAEIGEWMNADQP